MFATRSGVSHPIQPSKPENYDEKEHPTRKIVYLIECDLKTSIEHKVYHSLTKSSTSSIHPHPIG
jgi:hypothetical protein